MRCAVLDDFLIADELAAVNAAWPAPGWPGWVVYDRPEQRKRASDTSTPLPPALSAVLLKMARLDLGAMVGIGGSAADLSLYGAGLHSMPPGSLVAGHQDADTHARLGLGRAWSACLYVHRRWEVGWGGALVLCDRDRVRALPPVPGRLVVFDAREQRHLVRTVACPEGLERRSLALFGFLPEPGPGLRRRADFVVA